MIHGDLKGVRLWVTISTLNSNASFMKANILIGQNGRAMLADFGLLTIVSEPTYFTASTSTAMGGTTRWMSPELLHPELFGSDHSSPTKESDCYALGMVVYEVLSGQAPFAALKEYIVIRKVIEGGRPERPEGAVRMWFTADLWRMLKLCWTTQARSRPSIETVLECLEQISSAWEPLLPQVDKGIEEGEGDWDLSVLRCVRLFVHVLLRVPLLITPLIHYQGLNPKDAEDLKERHPLCATIMVEDGGPFAVLTASHCTSIFIVKDCYSSPVVHVSVRI